MIWIRLARKYDTYLVQGYPLTSIQSTVVLTYNLFPRPRPRNLNPRTSMQSTPSAPLALPISLVSPTRPPSFHFCCIGSSALKPGPMHLAPWIGERRGWRRLRLAGLGQPLVRRSGHGPFCYCQRSYGCAAGRGTQAPIVQRTPSQLGEQTAAETRQRC